MSYHPLDDPNMMELAEQFCLECGCASVYAIDEDILMALEDDFDAAIALYRSRQDEAENFADEAEDDDADWRSGSDIASHHYQQTDYEQDY